MLMLMLMLMKFPYDLDFEIQYLLEKYTYLAFEVQNVCNHNVLHSMLPSSCKLCEDPQIDATNKIVFLKTCFVKITVY